MPPTRIIVVGSGLYGLAFAETYMKIDPTASLTILEADPHLGGTWSTERVYPTLLAQQPCGSYEIPGYPLTEVNEISSNMGTYGNFIPGTFLSIYLINFAKKTGLYDKIIFNTRVSGIEKIGTVEDPHGWKIFVHGGKKDNGLDEPDYVCDKLVLAVGNTSTEQVPSIPSEELFTGIKIHSKYFGRELPHLTAPEIHTVTVYGGGKSALDTIHALVQAGKKVHWVIRPDETTPGLPFYANGVTLGINTLPFMSTRDKSIFIPNPEDTQSGVYNFLHSGKSWLGSWIFKKYWSFLGNLVLSRMNYTRSENGKKLIPQIKPEDGLIFWTNCTPAVLTSPEVIDWIHNGEHITVHRAEITAYSSANTITLATYPPSSTSPTHAPLTTDAIVFCTGYKHSTNLFLAPSLRLSLGFPAPLTSVPPEDAALWTPLTTSAHEHISAKFPYLKTPPTSTRIMPARDTPWRLYRHTIPLEYLRHQDRSFASVGTVQVLNTGIMTAINALWASAWLTGGYDPLESHRNGTASEVDVAMDLLYAKVAEESIWPSRRYLNHGIKGDAWMQELFFIFDAFLKDLGVNPQRKSTWLAHRFGAHYPSDYAKIVDEYLALKRAT
ncbi:hypothetical protein DFH27DRAFT_49872 [Peziza echinospora]|nr:hypothetical protein DFH27DRAFT_49872 [Peziza echinospora]